MGPRAAAAEVWSGASTGAASGSGGAGSAGSELPESSAVGALAFQAARSAALGALKALGRCQPPVLGDLQVIGAFSGHFQTRSGQQTHSCWRSYRVIGSAIQALAQPQNSGHEDTRSSRQPGQLVVRHWTPCFKIKTPAAHLQHMKKKNCQDYSLQPQHRTACS